MFFIVVCDAKLWLHWPVAPRKQNDTSMLFADTVLILCYFLSSANDNWCFVIHVTLFKARRGNWRNYTKMLRMTWFFPDIKNQKGRICLRLSESFITIKAVFLQSLTEPETKVQTHTCKYPNGLWMVGHPQTSHAVLATRSKVMTIGTELNIPNRPHMAFVHHEICPGQQAPKSEQQKTAIFAQKWLHFKCNSISYDKNIDLPYSSIFRRRNKKCSAGTKTHGIYCSTMTKQCPAMNSRNISNWSVKTIYQKNTLDSVTHATMENHLSPQTEHHNTSTLSHNLDSTLV